MNNTGIIILKTGLTLNLFCGIFLIVCFVEKMRTSRLRFAPDSKKRDVRLKKFLAEADTVLKLRAAYSSGGKSIFSGIRCEHLFIAGAILFALGGAIGAMLNNGGAAVILAAFLSTLPVLWLKTTKYKVYRNMDEQLEQVLGIITGSYIQSEDIIRAIAENLPRIEQPMHTIFAEFVTETSLTDASITDALINMKSKNGNLSFKEWCDVLIQCQNDRELKYVLTAIVEELSDNKKIMIETDTAMRLMWRDYFIMLVIVAVQIPMVRVINGEWYRILTNTPGGKAVIAVMLLICGITAFWVSGINNMDYKYGGHGK